MAKGYASPPDQAVFDQTVWEIVRQVPRGKVATYGQVAALISPPGEMNLKDFSAFGARWVGSSMARCPSDVPWQRVINAQGKISTRGAGGESPQRELLEEEGVVFDERGRVDLARYRWSGPSAEWLKAHGLAQDSSTSDSQQIELPL